MLCMRGLYIHLYCSADAYQSSLEQQGCRISLSEFCNREFKFGAGILCPVDDHYEYLYMMRQHCNEESILITSVAYTYIYESASRSRLLIGGEFFFFIFETRSVHSSPARLLILISLIFLLV